MTKKCSLKTLTQNAKEYIYISNVHPQIEETPHDNGEETCDGK